MTTRYFMCGFRFVVLKNTVNKLHTLDSNYIARLAFYLLVYMGDQSPSPLTTEELRIVISS